MKHHLHFIILNEADLYGRPAQLKDFRYFLKEEKEVDDLIRDEFPLKKYGEPEEMLNIQGSELLVHNFLSIRESKLDLNVKLGDIQFIGFQDHGNIILKFDYDLVAKGIYDFTSNFLDEVFKMGKFTRFCLENGYTDIISSNILNLSERMSDQEKQYRFIKKDDCWYIRGLTSTNYNNYDNHIAIYLCFLELHKMAKENNIYFKVQRAIISDSEINIFIEQTAPQIIIGLGQIYFGALISNSEIRDKAFTLEFRFRMVDEKGNIFGALPDIEEAIFSIKHDTGINNVKKKLEKLNLLGKFKDKMEKEIKLIGSTPHLTEDRIYEVFKKIYQMTQKLSPETRNTAKKFEEDQIVTKTMTIIEAFNRLSEITTDVNEKITLERLYYKAVMDMAKSYKKK